MMVTGDYHHTAIAVARGVGMILQGGQVVIIQAKAENQVLPRTPSRFPSAFKISNHQARLSPLAPQPVSFAQKAASPSAAFSELPAAPAEGQQREEDDMQRAQSCCEGLTFLLDSGDDLENWDPQHALTIIAQARICAFHLSDCLRSPSSVCHAVCACSSASTRHSNELNSTQAMVTVCLACRQDIGNTVPSLTCQTPGQMHSTIKHSAQCMVSVCCSTTSTVHTSNHNKAVSPTSVLPG